MTTVLAIDLDAVRENFLNWSRKAHPGKCAAVVKADAYGLGAEVIAPAIAEAGCEHFFTALPEEAMRLRPVLPDRNIYVFSGVQNRNIEEFQRYSLIPVLNDLDQVRCWTSLARKLQRPLPCLIHIDTGMNRLGFDSGTLHALVRNCDELRWLDVRYVITHFACADDPDDEFSSAQRELFDELRRVLPAAPTSIGNSAGTMLGPKYAGDLARIGIALYGANPGSQPDNPSRLVVRMLSEVLQIRELDCEQPIGYGSTKRLPAGSRIATIGTGYADGLPRSLSNRGFAFIAGQRVPIVGRVSMDLTMLDVSSIPLKELKAAKEAELIGANITLEEVAGLAGTINYEILTGLGRRARRRYLTRGASSGQIEGAGGRSPNQSTQPYCGHPNACPSREGQSGVERS